jgi:hypothetical protein
MNMRWEALLWSLLAVTAPAAAQVLWRRINPSLPEWAEPLINGAGWLHGLILPYIALIVGSIPGGLVGLYGTPLLGWIVGGLACLLGLIAVALTHRYRPRSALQSRPALVRWQDEPRWALYRASGALWLQDLALGAGLGFVLSIIEWALSGLSNPARNFIDLDREPLYRSGVSAILFLLTRNFWLTAGTQLFFFILLELWFNQQLSSTPQSNSTS